MMIHVFLVVYTTRDTRHNVDNKYLQIFDDVFAAQESMKKHPKGKKLYRLPLSVFLNAAIRNSNSHYGINFYDFFPREEDAKAYEVSEPNL